MSATSPSALLQSITRPRFLLTRWPWRGFAYSITTSITSGLVWIGLSCLIAPAVGAVSMLRSHHRSVPVALVFALASIVLIAVVGPPLAVVCGRVERWCLRLADDRPAHNPGRGNLYRDPATWRAFAYMLILAVVAPVWLGTIALVFLLDFSLLVAPLAVHLSGSIVIGTAAVHSTGTAIGLAVIGIGMLPILAYLVAAFGGAHAALSRLLLAPERSASELVEVERSRARLADAFDAERNRIERDLHDGAQQRVVNLTMQLGLAKLDLPADSPAASAIESAQEQAKALMVELRDLVRGINPRTLTELGLAAALDELAASCTVPTTVRIDVPRLAAAMETVAYFAVSEALTNAVKHSAATRATVTAVHAGHTLVVEIRDDGRGGAGPAGGSGLRGLADRVAAASGRLLLSSPPGGPTVVRIELPCGS